MKKIFLCFLMIPFLIMPFFVMAQEAEMALLDDSESLDIEIIADTNARNIALFPLDEKNYGVSFDIVNEWDKTQPDVRYALEIFASDEQGGYLVDKVVYDDDISLLPGQSVHKELTYAMPSSLPIGDYNMEIKLTSKKGMDLALSEVGTLQKKDQEGLYIDPSTCYLKVGQEQFALMQGVDLSQDEQFYLVCENVTNFNDESKSIRAQMITRERVATGPMISQQDLAETEFAAGESKQISYSIDRPEKAQSYEGRILLYMDDGSSVSNGINFRYVVQGISATVQNATTDKDYYSKGEIAKVSVMASGIASAFPGARDQHLADDMTELENFFLNVSIVDVNNEMCSDEIFEKTGDLSGNIHLDIAISKDCVDPTVVVKIRDVNDVILDDVEFSLDTSSVDEADSAEAGQKETNLTKKIAVAIAVVPFIVLIIYFVNRKRKGGMNTVIFGALFCASFLLLSAGNVEAAAFSTGKYHCFTLYGVKGYCVVNGTYDVGANQKDCEDVIASASMSWSACSNITLDARLFINGSRVWRDTSKDSDYAKTIWASNSSGLKTKNLGKYPVGTHTVNYKMTFYHDWHDWGFNERTEKITASKNFNVTRCAVNGSCGTRHTKTGEWTTRDLGRYTTCSSGTFSWVSGLTSGTIGRWEWRCSGSNGGASSGICWAKPPTVNGRCSTGKIANPVPWDQTAWRSLSATHFCASGTPRPNPPMFPGHGDSVRWTCEGSGPNHVNASCSAERQEPPACTCSSTAENGPYDYRDTRIVGDLCTYGTPSIGANPTFPGTYGGEITWTCSAPNCTGAADNCRASREEPDPCACGPSNGNDAVLSNVPVDRDACAAGDDAYVNDNNGVFNWTCGTTNVEYDGAGGMCLGQVSCSAGCVSANIEAPASVYLNKDGNEIDVTVEIENSEKVLSGDCTLSATGTTLVGGGASVTASVSDIASQTYSFVYPENGTVINLDCPALAVDCDGDGNASGTARYTDSHAVQSVCMQRSCNAQGKCQATPQPASSYDECSSTCNSDADCSTGRMIETRP